MPKFVRARYRKLNGLITAVVAFCLVATPLAAQQGLPNEPVTPVVVVEDPSVATSIPAASTAHPERWPRARWPIARDEAGEQRIAAIIAAMSVEEKVGQLIQADLAFVTPEDARRYHLGSILSGGDSGPNGDDFAPPEQWLAMADAFYAASTDRSTGGAGIPIVWGTDAVHGNSNVVGATLFPHNIGLGAMRNPALMRRIGEITAIEIRATGQEWTFAPTLAVPQNYRWGRTYEGYSSDPRLVARYASAFVRGLQGEPNSGPILQGPHVAATAKHFIGDGGTFDGRDQGDTRASEAQLRDTYAAPYIAALNAGVGSVMVSFSSWNGVKLTGNRSLVTGVLRERMGFDGMVVSDWNAAGQLAGCSNASCPRALNAGIDVYMAPDEWRALFANLVAQVRSGEVPMARLDEAVAHVLRFKLRMGLLDAPRPSERPLSGQWDLLGSAEHRAVARQAVRESLVLLKNNDQVLPLNPHGRILVAGDAANDVARQSGGWSLSWNGRNVDPDNFSGATTIWQGIELAAAAAGGSAILAPGGDYTGVKPDAAIVVFGETPYAEFEGDIATLELPPELLRPIETMRRLQAEGIPVVAVMITGRPLYMNAAINAADAFVVGWLPGSEGAGVADMLFAPQPGARQYEFRGRLGFAWPASADPEGPTLFRRGYGLRMSNRRQLGLLAEVAAPWRNVGERSTPGSGSEPLR